jgi:inosine/xanthosine triphosphate pyrophosphatase family protein
MIEIIVGTTNEAKVKQILGALAPLNISVKGVENKDLLPKVDEDGQTAIENARKKAIAYAEALNQTILSMDNALYLDGLTDDQQPGLNVRRIGNGDKRPTDEDLLRHYSEVIKRLGGRINGHWEFGVCIANSQGSLGEINIISPRVFTSEISTKVVPGYPLESLQVDPESGKYIAEMQQSEQDEFWQKAIGKPLCDFVSSTLKI